MEKAALYSHSTSKGVQCDLCPHTCNLSDGQSGLCHARSNHGGVLYAESYGHLCAVCDDPIEKKPLFHFYPGSRCLSVSSAGCNFACLNCQNWEISQVKSSAISTMDISSEDVVAKCKERKCRSIAYTYTEPLVSYEYTYDTACSARSEGIKNIIVSNGFINEEPLRQLSKVIDAANIDLKFFSDEMYSKVCNGNLHTVLNTLKILHEAGVWLEITNLLIPTYNDAPEMIRLMCGWLADNGFTDTPLHFSRFFPMYKMRVSPTPLKSLLQAREIAWHAGMKYVYIGNVNEMEGENTYCSNCKKLLIRRQGFNVYNNCIIDGKCPECGNPVSGVW